MVVEEVEQEEGIPSSGHVLFLLVLSTIFLLVLIKILFQNNMWPRKKNHLKLTTTMAVQRVSGDCKKKTG